jgi:hypothetical protein
MGRFRRARIVQSAWVVRGWVIKVVSGIGRVKIKGAQFGYIRVNASNIRRDYCQAHVFREEIAHFHHQKASQSLERAKTIGFLLLLTPFDSE